MLSTCIHWEGTTGPLVARPFWTLALVLFTLVGF